MGSDYLLRDGITAADIMMGYSLALAKRVAVLADGHPVVDAYQSRLEARPGFAKGMT